MRPFLTILAFASALSQAAVYAHPGHGSSEHQSGVAHYVTSPSHIVPVVVTLALGVAAGVLYRRFRGRKSQAAA